MKLTQKEKLVVAVVCSSKKPLTVKETYAKLMKRGREISFGMVNVTMKKLGLGKRRGWRATGANSKLHRFAFQAGVEKTMAKVERLRLKVEKMKQVAKDSGYRFNLKQGVLA